MALSAEELHAIRQWVGDTPDDSVLNVVYGYEATFDGTVMYVLNMRLASLSAEPGSITVPGLSVSHSTDLEALKLLISRFQNSGGTGLDEEPMFTGIGFSTIRRNFPR